MARALGRSRESAVRLAVTISAAGIALTVAYLGLMTVAGTHLLTALFGDSFEEYGALVVPICVWQVVAAAGLGFAILLKAEQRGRALFAIGTAAIAAQLVASASLAAVAGVEGAAWGLSAGAAVGTILQVVYAVRADLLVRGAPVASESASPRSSAGVA